METFKKHCQYFCLQTPQIGPGVPDLERMDYGAPSWIGEIKSSSFVVKFVSQMKGLPESLDYISLSSCTRKLGLMMNNRAGKVSCIIITARIRSTTARFCFYGCLSVNRGFTPSPSHNTSIHWCHDLPGGGTPSPSHNTSTGPMSLWGTPSRGYTLSGTGWGNPLIWDWMALEQVMPRAVCLLHFPAGGLSCWRLILKGSWYEE